MDSLGLEPELTSKMADYGVANPWEVLSAMRGEIYEDMVADPQVLRDNRWPHTIDLLRAVSDAGCRTALATMSQRQEAMRVLQALEIESFLEVVLTREDVEQPKPDPEIYLLAAERLEVQPQDCLVLEDSPNGVRAGVAAGMNVIAVATPFTAASLHSSQILEHNWVVHQPEDLLEVVKQRIAEHNRTGH
jgi:HAD superfamily hydrolase (TIGR01509 family)